MECGKQIGGGGGQLHAVGIIWEGLGMYGKAKAELHAGLCCSGL